MVKKQTPKGIDHQLPSILPENLIERGRQTLGQDPNIEGFILGQGNLDPKMIFVGEAPGADELQTGVPFSGRAGIELENTLAFLGLSRETIYLTSAFHSRPFKTKIVRNKISKSNRPPTQKEIKMQAFVVDTEIKLLPKRMIVTIGNIGLQRLVGPNYQVGQVHGNLIESPIQIFNENSQKFEFTSSTFQIFPTFHPAAVFYNRKLAATLQMDLVKLKKIIDNED